MIEVLTDYNLSILDIEVTPTNIVQVKEMSYELFIDSYIQHIIIDITNFDIYKLFFIKELLTYTDFLMKKQVYISIDLSQRFKNHLTIIKELNQINYNGQLRIIINDLNDKNLIDLLSILNKNSDFNIVVYVKFSDVKHEILILKEILNRTNLFVNVSIDRLSNKITKSNYILLVKELDKIVINKEYRNRIFYDLPESCVVSSLACGICPAIFMSLRVTEKLMLSPCRYSNEELACFDGKTIREVHKSFKERYFYNLSKTSCTSCSKLDECYGGCIVTKNKDRNDYCLNKEGG